MVIDKEWRMEYIDDELLDRMLFWDSLDLEIMTQYIIDNHNNRVSKW